MSAKRRTVKGMLRDIDTFLAKGTVESAQLWAVLTALRGPDSGEYKHKLKYTIPIRRKALPKTAAIMFVAGSSRQAPADFGTEANDGLPVFMGEPIGPHFANHIQEAISALLDNEPKGKK